MKDWKRYSVAQLISDNALFIGDGYRAKNEELSTHGIPFARVSNINEGFHFEDADHFPKKDLQKVGNKISQHSDVVFTSKGTVGRFAFVRNDVSEFVYSPQLCFWRVLDQEIIDPRFLFFWMSGREFFLQFNGVKGQTDMADYVSLADQRKMHITLPPLPEQRAIAGILGALDDKIEVNRRMNVTLESMARAVFREMTSDVEKQGSILEFADLLGGGTPKTSEPSYWDGDIEWVSAKDVGNVEGIFLLDTEKKITQGGVDNSSTKLLPEKTTIVTARGTVGAHCILGKPMTMNQSNYGLKAKKGIGDYFVYFTLSEMIGQLKQQSYGTIFDTITTKIFQNVQCAQPSHDVIQKIEDQITPMMEAILNNQNESRTLGSLRDSLLPKLMRGEVRVKEQYTIGVLAYGSLIANPGTEIEQCTYKKIEDIDTPFSVEYARKSSTRANAPTLVPVANKTAASVKASIFVLNREIKINIAEEILYRREIHRVGDMNKTYQSPTNPNVNSVQIKSINNYGGVDKVLFTSIGANIPEIIDDSRTDEEKAQLLADLAIGSVTDKTFSNKKDGIYYLDSAIKNGVITRLTDLYRNAILQKTENSSSLENAREWVAKQKKIV